MVSVRAGGAIRFRTLMVSVRAWGADPKTDLATSLLFRATPSVVPHIILSRRKSGS